MRRSILCVLFMVPALMVLTTTSGCGKKEEAKKAKKEEAKKEEAKKNGEEDDKLTALDAKLDGTISGKITFDGTPPDPAFIKDINTAPDKVVCLKGKDNGETVDPTWRVDKAGGVANVVIWLEPPSGKYFNLTDADKKRTDVVEMGQPHCAFVPHVVAVYPKYFDGKKLIKSGQVFQLKNNAPMLHNSKWAAGSNNKPFNETIDKGDKREPLLNPQDEPLEIGCTIHRWMTGYIWVFDNPYHAVTKDDGSYTIKNVPTDVEVTVVGWHESQKKPFFRQKKTFKKGDNTVNLKVKN